MIKQHHATTPTEKYLKKVKTMLGGQKNPAKDRLRKKIADSRKGTDINIAAHIKNCIVARPPTNLRGVVPLILTHPPVYTVVSPCMLSQIQIKSGKAPFWPF